MSAPWPPQPPRQPRPRLDARWLTVIVLGIIVIVVLDRENRIHLNSFDLLYFAAIIPSVILHEITHGWVALAFGDQTAKRAGRLTLNPLVHVSIVGTVIVPALLVLAGYPAFGWAKPVPVNIGGLRHPRNDYVVVALAGPALNILLAVIFGLIFRLAVPFDVKVNVAINFGTGAGQYPWALYLFILGYANVILAVFNLIPLPPLDGSSVLERLLPRSWLPDYLRLRPYTIFLPLLLIMFRAQLFSDIFQPFLTFWEHLPFG